MLDLRMSRRTGLWTGIITTIALVGFTFWGRPGAVKATGESYRPVISQTMLMSLLIGPEELPWNVVLSTIDIGTGTPSARLASFKGQAKFEERWSGRPKGAADSRKTPETSVDIAVAIANSAEESVQIALDKVCDASVVIPEITGEREVAAFADRAWYGNNELGESKVTSANITFTRHNVVCNIGMSHKSGFDDKKLLFALATRLSHRIDAALAGKPEPLPMLPLAADQELRVDLEGAWRIHDLAVRLWSDGATTIALYDSNGIPRSLPAKRMGADYVVPLRHLAAIFGPRARVDIRDNEAHTVLVGKALVLNKGKSEMRVDQRVKRLDRAVEFAEGEALVPLISLVNNALGRSINWEKRGSIAVGRIM